VDYRAFLEFLKIPKEAALGKYCSDIFFNGTNEPVIDIPGIVCSGEIQKGIIQTFFCRLVKKGCKTEYYSVPE